MKVIREKSILEKIDAEIDDKTKPPIVRIDLDEEEFRSFLTSICDGVLSTNFAGELNRLKVDLSHLVGNSRVNFSVTTRGLLKYRGSYIVYRNVCVQCCYEESKV